MTSKFSPMLLLMMYFFSRSVVAAAGIEINKEVVLSPGHPVAPYLIAQTSNGDFIVAGSTGYSDFWPWATRVSPSGGVLWEYVNGPANAWNDHSMKGQRFYGAVELPNQNILLCGMKTINGVPSVFLLRLHSDGSLIDERPLHLDHQGDLGGGGMVCTRWEGGMAVFGGLSGDPSGIGWLVKLDPSGEIVWQKFSDDFGLDDAMEGQGGTLFQIGWLNRHLAITKYSSSGELLQRHPISNDNKWQLVHPPIPRATVRAIGAQTSSETDVVDFDEKLNGPTHSYELKNAGFKKAIEQPDGSVVIFGSQFLRGAATASIALLSKGGISNSFLIEPKNKSLWFEDAVPAAHPNEFATVRSVGGDATLAWISVK